MTIMQRMQAEMVKKRKGEKKGFTLVELVVVIAILAILAAIAIPIVSSIIGTANKNTDDSNAKTFELAIKAAQAEVKAGVTTTYSATATVADVISLNGFSLSAKQGGTFAFYWVKDNRTVVCSDSAPTNGIALSGNTTEIASLS